MATAPLTSYVPVEVYLRTSYRPDVDYVDGRVEERNLGEFDHGRLILELAKYFDRHRSEWRVRVALDTRLQVAETRYRVPDLSVSSLDAPKEQILRTPPLVCIEVLSPEDTFRKMRVRVEEYLALGVRSVWVLDYHERSVTLCQRDAADVIQHRGVAMVPGTPIAVPLDEMFAALDQD